MRKRGERRQGDGEGRGRAETLRGLVTAGAEGGGAAASCLRVIAGGLWGCCMGELKVGRAATSVLCACDRL